MDEDRNRRRQFHLYIYEENFQKTVRKLIKSDLSFVMQRDKRNNKKLKKQDLIRITNSSKKMEDIKDSIYEFILLKNAKMFFEIFMSYEILYINTISKE